MDNLRAYLNQYREALKLSGIERELNMPAKTLEHFVHGRRGLGDHEPRVVEYLTRLGYNPEQYYDVIV